jgi:hypothetical protein
LERVSSRWHRYSVLVSELVNLKQGIQSTNIQPTTGNVLITFDADVLGEKDILEWLENVGKIILSNMCEYSSISEENLELLLNRIRPQLMALEK